VVTSVAAAATCADSATLAVDTTVFKWRGTLGLGDSHTVTAYETRNKPSTSLKGRDTAPTGSAIGSSRNDNL
jgi:hypothetical protein